MGCGPSSPLQRFEQRAAPERDRLEAKRLFYAQKAQVHEDRAEEIQRQAVAERKASRNSRAQALALEALEHSRQSDALRQHVARLQGWIGQINDIWTSYMISSDVATFSTGMTTIQESEQDVDAVRDDIADAEVMQERFTELVKTMRKEANRVLPKDVDGTPIDNKQVLACIDEWSKRDPPARQVGEEEMLNTLFD